MGSIRLTRDFDDDRPVDHAIRECHCQWGVAEIFGPSLEVDICDESGRSLLAASVDDLIEQAGRLRRFLAFQAVETEFVDDQQVEASVFPQARR